MSDKQLGRQGEVRRSNGTGSLRRMGGIQVILDKKHPPDLHTDFKAKGSLGLPGVDSVGDKTRDSHVIIPGDVHSCYQYVLATGKRKINTV